MGNIGHRLPFGNLNSDIKILFSIPTLKDIHKVTVYMSFAMMISEKRFKGDYISPTHVPFENCLHHIVNDFMDKGYDYWVSIDPDNGPRNNIFDLVLLDKDIIGCPTPIWHCEDPFNGERPYYFNGYDYVKDKDAYGEHKEKKGLQKVDAIGTGAFIIARRVFENKEMRKAPFQRQYNLDGTVYKGNDLSFCERARKQGFDIYCHYDYPCFHFNNIEIGEAIMSFSGIKKVEDS